MAEQATYHHWINTAIAAVAFITSGASAYFSWTANKLSEEAAAQARENIGISSRLTFKCPFVFDRTSRTSVPTNIGVCWKLTFFNRSTQPSDITDILFLYQHKTDLFDNSPLAYSIFSMTVGDNENPLVTLPIPLPGRGHARAVIRVMIPAEPGVADKVEGFRNEYPGNSTVRDFSTYLAWKAKLDVFGHKLHETDNGEPIFFDDLGQYSPYSVSLITSLNKQFGTDLNLGGFPLEDLIP